MPTRFMHPFLIAGAALMLLSTAPLFAQTDAPKPDPTRWEKTIRAFESRDRKNSVPDNAVLFIGSSSIVGWSSAKDFPNLPVINRGFGGSHISDVNHYIDRIVLPYKPAVIVFYAGDNDVAGGKSPERVAKDLATFVSRVHAALPQTTIIFVAIKPSLARWDKWETMRSANESIEAMCERDDRLLYADIAAPMIGADGKPRPELFAKDGLHLNAQGYAEWNRVVGPLIDRARKPAIDAGKESATDG